MVQRTLLRGLFMALIFCGLCTATATAGILDELLQTHEENRTDTAAPSPDAAGELGQQTACRITATPTRARPGDTVAVRFDIFSLLSRTLQGVDLMFNTRNLPELQGGAMTQTGGGGYEYSWTVPEGAGGGTSIQFWARSSGGTVCSGGTRVIIIDTLDVKLSGPHTVEERQPCSVWYSYIGGVPPYTLTWHIGDRTETEGPYQQQRQGYRWLGLFDEPGSYRIGLGVTDGDAVYDYRQYTLEVEPEKLRVWFSTAWSEALVGEPLTFGIEVAGGVPPYQYTYSFGDGGTQWEESGMGSHTYQRPGFFTITVTVTDQEGHEGSVSRQVWVEACPEGYEQCLDGCMPTNSTCCETGPEGYCSANEDCCGQGCCDDASFCFEEGCCPDTAVGCTGAGYCCPGGYGCCDDGGCCPDGDTCCAAQCCSGDCHEDRICCRSGDVFCGEGCCPSGSRCCTSTGGSGGCCPQTQQCCGGRCCLPGYKCCNNDHCCPEDQECTPTGCTGSGPPPACTPEYGCCAENPQVCGSNCIPADAACCNGLGWCDAGEACCYDPPHCIPAGTTCCGTGACAAGTVCCPGGTNCCPSQAQCCGTGCCPGGYFCCPGGNGCCPVGTTCSGGGQCI
jgi:hypothetical protein